MMDKNKNELEQKVNDQVNPPEPETEDVDVEALAEDLSESIKKILEGEEEAESVAEEPAEANEEKQEEILTPEESFEEKEPAAGDLQESSSKESQETPAVPEPEEKVRDKKAAIAKTKAMNLQEKKDKKSFPPLQEKKTLPGKKIGIGAGIVLAALLLIYVGMSVYFQNRFTFGSVINGEKVTGKTVDEVEKTLDESTKNYTLTIEERSDEKEQIHASEIDLIYVPDGSVQKKMDAQNGFAWPAALFGSSEDSEMAVPVEYDENALKEVYNKLEAFNKDKVNSPVSAYPTYDEGEKAFVIADEVYGNEMDEEKLYEAVTTAIENGDETVSADKENCYVDPEFTAESAEVIKACETLNKYADVEITYEFGKNTEVLDKSTTHSWFTVSDDWEVSIDEEQVKEYVDYIGSTYNTFGRQRKFTTTGGQEINITQGDYGYWMNRPEEVAQLTEAIKNGDSGVREPVYFSKGASYDDPDYGNTYVEISLSAQYMWFYKNGKLVVGTPVVTGNVSRNYSTPTGIYGITYTERNATLTGENYSNPVDFWMPFNGNVGIHDASWRSSFGGNIYRSSGSHGCVNTPYAAAKTIFDNIKKGDPVIVY